MKIPASIKLKFIFLFGIFIEPTVAFGQLPSNLQARWVVNPLPGAASTSRPQLTWTAPAASTFIIQRAYENSTAYTTITNPQITTDGNTRTFTDTAATANPTATTGPTIRFIYYRVGTNAASSLSEVAIIGNPSLAFNSPEKDSDADGLPDNVEDAYSAHPLNPLEIANWADGTGDADGDSVPNAWELALLPPAAGMYNSSSTPTHHLTVNRNNPISPTNFHTISAAVAALPVATASIATQFRIIRVSPGLYNEDLSVTSRHVAILPLRTPKPTSNLGEPVYRQDPLDTWEIRGLHATNPVVTITNSTLVLDGFILSRSPGSQGPIVSVSETAMSASRFYVSRLANCLIANAATGPNAVVEQSRSRLILSHCTLFMNGPASGATSAAYGPTNTTIATTSRLIVHNSIFWNPVNTSIPEINPPGTASFLGTLFHYRENQVNKATQQPTALIPGTIFRNPMLTPAGYLIGPVVDENGAPPDTGAMRQGALGVHVQRDITGEWRGTVPEDPNKNPDSGAHQWWDDDQDGIPNFADRLVDSAANIDDDLDLDTINELREYRYGTNIFNSDTYFLSVHQAVQMFMPIEDRARFWRKGETIRLAPAGDISMGPFTQGVAPPTFP
jgi:hypothetical protein